MSDPAHSTLSNSEAELTDLVTNGFPPVKGPSDEQLREDAQALAMAVAYTWLNHDDDAQDAFLDQIIALNTDGAGIMFAIDLFTTIRLLGAQPGTLRHGPDVEITTHWRPDLDNAPAVHYQEVLDLITDLWTGIAVGDMARTGRAKAALYEIPLHQVRDVLRIMAFDTSILMEQFATWQGSGSETWEAYRHANPPANPAHPAPPVST